MKLKKIAITNYRQFQNAVINFDDELTILAGANNSGKTSIVKSICFFCTGGWCVYSLVQKVGVFPENKDADNYRY